MKRVFRENFESSCSAPIMKTPCDESQSTQLDKPLSDCVRRNTSIQELKLVHKQPYPSSILAEHPSHTSTCTTASSCTSNTCNTYNDKYKNSISTRSKLSSLSNSNSCAETENDKRDDVNVVKVKGTGHVDADVDAVTHELEMLILSDTHEHLENELARRAEERQMTCAQEVYNAITMLPQPLTCIYFILMGKWLTDDNILQARDEMEMSSFSEMYNYISDGDLMNDINNGDGIHNTTTYFNPSPHSSHSSYTYLYNDDQCQCISSSLLPNLHSLPPLTTMAVVTAFILHTPCSIQYHLLCAFKLPPGPKRMDHWSRRLDQAMIHWISFFLCYGLSGSIDYALISLAFTLDSMYRLFQSGHRPKRILIRMVGAFLMPVLPLVTNGYILEVMQLLAIYGVSGWLFSTYPFKGWSHGTFHLVCALSVPIYLDASTKLMVSQGAIQMAAKCAVLAQATGFD